MIAVVLLVTYDENIMDALGYEPIRIPHTTQDWFNGVMESTKEKDPKIYVNPYLTKQSELNTIVHEMAHAFFWDKPEKDIFAYANAVSRMLYNHQGWRKIEGDNHEPKKKSPKNKE